jgi:hypothetical protein
MDRGGAGSMTDKLGMIGRVAVVAVMTPIVFCSGVWATLALWYRLPGGRIVRALGSALWVIATGLAYACAIVGRSWWPLVVYVVLYAILLSWWITIKPSGARDWRDDVARVLTGSVHGDRVVLHDVRHFRWRSDTDYDMRWERHDYDLAQLASADAVLSHWGSRAIAHAMISFGFDDGRHLVFSVEVRKSRDQEYSAVGGFFKQFETILVAAEEDDIIRVRTNVRGEDVYLYPLQLERATLRALLLSYVHAANRLAAQPAFYNSFTSNCTTIVHRMARQIDRGLPWDMRLLLTGYLPEYLQDIGALDRDVPIGVLRDRARISDRAMAAPTGSDFSRVVRAASPG